jgi:hypothetical protein
MLIIMSIVYIILLILLAKSAHTKFYLYTKTALSLFSAIIAFVGAMSRGTLVMLAYFLPGLFGFLLGDIALAFKTRKSLKVGIAAFTAGDLFFLRFFSRYRSFSIIEVLAGLALFAIVYLIDRKKLISFTGIRHLTFLYAFLEGMAVMKSVLAYRFVPSQCFLMMATGMVLYLISDSILMVYKFKIKNIIFGAIALALYYGGLYLMTSSFFFI